MRKRVIIAGVSGKMGGIVHELLQENDDFEYLCGFDKYPHMLRGAIFGTTEEMEEELAEMSKPDVIIDFSLPEGTEAILKYALKNEVPIVIATTAIEGLKEQIEGASKVIPVFQSANMSYEVAVIKKTLQLLAKLLPGTDIEICETHHNRKADAPSGTALMLANAMNEALDGTMDIVYGREGKRESNEIGISSMRGGDIPGTHSTYFFGTSETLELTHTVHKRAVFAEGAIKAAKFLVEQSPGLYNMEDLIGKLI